MANKDLLEMLKRKIFNGEELSTIKKFVLLNQNEKIYLEIEEELKQYFEEKSKSNEKNKKYWMLVCNPMHWGDEEGEFKVNELLKNLHKQEDGEWWKINDKTNMELKMKIGHRGIIKVSEDTRNDDLRTDNNDEIVPLLDAGLYGIFEVTNDHEGDFVFKFDNGYWYIHIKMIDNYFDNGLNISKEKSRELIGETIYNSQSSRKLDKVLFDKVIDFIDNKRNYTRNYN
jgi:hypothetical protein